MEKQLPKNWMGIKFENIGEATDFVANGSFQSLSENVIQKEEPDYAILVRLKDFSSKWKGNFRYVTKESYEFLGKSSLIEGDLFIANVGYPGKLFLVPDLGQPMTIGPNGLRVRANSISSNKFLKYYYLSPQGKEEINKIVSGTAQQKFNKTGFRQSIIPLPPLAEQNRIVDKLNRLFDQLETIKTSMVNISILLKDFRQQVLTQAVTGKLTEEWRKGKKLKELSLIELSHFCKDSFYGPRFSKDDYTSEGFPTVRTTDMSDDGKIILSNNIPRIKIDDPKKIELYKVKKGDLLITRTGSIGKMARYFEEEIVIPSAYLIRFRFNELAITDYIYYCLISPYGQNQMGLNSVAVTQPNLNAQKIKTIKIPNISINEQLEIISRVESLFAKADAIEQQYKTLKQKIDTLPQALLHKAFKGELTEQLVSDGDARELLKEIETLKAISGKVGKKNGKIVKTYKEDIAVLNMVAEPNEEFESKVVKLKPTNSEIYKRTLLAAEIVYQLKETNTLGHLKLQKMLYLCQEIGSMNLPMNFLKQAMGPYDNQLARSIDKQFVIKKWFEYQKGALLKYQPLENCGNHKEDFHKYFETETEQINYLINKFKKFTSNQIEAVATLYACWKEAIEKKELISDKLIITKFYQWSKEKEKFREENMIKALNWMRRHGVEPK